MSGGDVIDLGLRPSSDRIQLNTCKILMGHLFKILQIWNLDNKKWKDHPQTTRHSQWHWGSNPQPFCKQAGCIPTTVLVCGMNVRQWWNLVTYWEDWSSIKFGENDAFRKLFLFFENTFQYLGGISQDISGSHFDSRRSLSSANRQQIVGDLPGRFFLSALLSLVISMTGRSERSARALRDGADVVREAIGN